MSDAGHIIGGPVDPDYDGAVLTADLTVGDTVLHVDDVADFDEDAVERDARVIVGLELDGDGNLDPATGTSMAYIACDDDASTVTLASASTVAASTGDRVYIANPLTGLPTGQVMVMVAVDDSDTTGDALPATMDLGLLTAAGDDDLTDQAVDIDEDEDGQLHVTGLPGLAQMSGDVKFMQDELTVLATGDQTFTLTYQPIKNSEHLYWNGVYQKGSEWARDQWDVTIPDPDSVIEAGDLLVMEYAYKDPTTKPPPLPVVIDVPLTLGQLIQYSTDGTFTTTDVGLPVTFKSVNYPTPTDDHMQDTYLYPLDWDGLDAAGLDFVPATPSGFALASICFAMTAHLSGGAPDPITVDTSGWGYNPPPTESPNIVFGLGGGPLFDVFPSSDAEVVSGDMGTISPSAGDFASPFRYQKWNGLVALTPPYPVDPREIVASAIVIRFTYTAVS